MKVTILGAGPAGLYASILLKRKRPDLEITIIEQNAANATFGFGVVFSDQALTFLQADDPETADLIEPAMKRWSDIAVVHRQERISIDGIGFAGIGRLELLKLLQQRAAELDIQPLYNQRVNSVDDLPETDLLIGADGLNSIVRQSSPEAFGAKIDNLSNRFVWYGTNKEYDALTQSFIETPFGPMNAHHYSYAKSQSTFIVEMTERTFRKSGFSEMTEPEYRAVCENLFESQLGGANLIPNNSSWRQFPNLTCETWHNGNQVLVGDALHTAHFSIGSGTRLALEDVMALVSALQGKNWEVPQALAAYQAARQPILEKITAAAKKSASWYEGFEQHMEQEPWPFALDYIRRAGRLDATRLSRLAPLFTQNLINRGIDLELTRDGNNE